MGATCPPLSPLTPTPTSNPYTKGGNLPHPQTPDRKRNCTDYKRNCALLLIKN